MSAMNWADACERNGKGALADLTRFAERLDEESGLRLRAVRVDPPDFLRLCQDLDCESVFVRENGFLGLLVNVHMRGRASRWVRVFARAT